MASNVDGKTPLSEVDERRARIVKNNERRVVAHTIPEHPGIDLHAKSFLSPVSTDEFYVELTNYACTSLGIPEEQLFSGIRVQNLKNTHWYKYFKPARIWIDVTTDYTESTQDWRANTLQQPRFGADIRQSLNVHGDAYTDYSGNGLNVQMLSARVATFYKLNSVSLTDAGYGYTPGDTVTIDIDGKQFDLLILSVDANGAITDLLYDSLALLHTPTNWEDDYALSGSTGADAVINVITEPYYIDGEFATIVNPENPKNILYQMVARRATIISPSAGLDDFLRDSSNQTQLVAGVDSNGQFGFFKFKNEDTGPGTIIAPDQQLVSEREVRELLNKATETTGGEVVGSLDAIPEWKDPEKVPGEIALIKQQVVHPGSGEDPVTKTLRILHGVGIGGTLVETDPLNALLTISANGGPLGAIVNMDNDYPLPEGMYYSAAPTSDPNGVFVLDVIPPERRLIAQVVAFKGISKGYLIQNSLERVNTPPYDILNPDNYADISYWHEINAWYYNDFIGGQSKWDYNMNLHGGDAAGSGLQEIFGGYAAA
jgi:hypothetical protein